MMINIPLENNGIFPVIILSSDEMQQESDLQCNLFTSLKIIDIFEKHLNSFILVKYDQPNDQRQAQKVQLQSATELCILEDLGNEYTKVCPQEHSSQHTEELIHLVIEVGPVAPEIHISSE